MLENTLSKLQLCFTQQKFFLQTLTLCLHKPSRDPLQWSIPRAWCCHLLADDNGVFLTMLLHSGAGVSANVLFGLHQTQHLVRWLPWFRSHQTMMGNLYLLVRYPGNSCYMNNIFHLSHEPCRSVRATKGLMLTLRSSAVQYSSFSRIELIIAWGVSSIVQNSNFLFTGIVAKEWCSFIYKGI